MKDKQTLSALEWEIMTAIWDMGGKPSVREVLEKLYPNGEKAYTTVQTVMNILVEKGFLTKEKIGLVGFYKPRKKRHEMVEKSTSSFVERVFGGSFNALANYLVDSDSLTKSEIAELKKLLDKKGGKK
jgi:predicted transcriptional regulator